MTLNSSPPRAKVKPHKLITHGHSRIDNYYWLKEKNNPDVISYLKAENDYSREVMGQTGGLQKKLYEEMVGRIKETDSSAPIKFGEYFYYIRTEEGKQYPIYCRKKGSLDVKEEILIDLNAIAVKNGYDYLRLGIYKISPSHNILAYSLDVDGSENFTILFRDLKKGILLSDQIKNTSFSAEWANDNKTLFYTVRDEAKRSYKLFRHTLGSDQKEDFLIYHEKDKLFNVYVSKTKDKDYIMLTINSIETAENFFLNANEPHRDFNIIHPREKGVRYFIRHHKGVFYVVTNDNARNYKVMKVKVENPIKSNWEEYISHNENVLVDDIEVFSNHMIVYERKDGIRTLRILNLSDAESRDVSFPEPVYTYSSSANPEFESNLFRFNYMSMTTADTVVDLDMFTMEWNIVKRKPVLGDYDPANYLSERIYAHGDDGTKIPISLVYRKDFVKNGYAPCLLYGYGSYGASIEPGFDSNRLSLLDRGFMFAIAHVRGGQEMGRHWYDQGKLLNKKNTFTDFISCARHLISEKYTSSEKLAIVGRSAGGLLIGAVVNMAPELFKVVVAGVPFVDVVTTMLDDSIPLTVGEFEEWGNPRNKEYYDYMVSYSPYDNAQPKEYPNILVTAGLNDPRVQYWEPAKWVAKLRSLKTDNNLLLLKTFMGAGHFSSSGRYDYLKDIAFEFAFILNTLGIDEK